MQPSFPSALVAVACLGAGLSAQNARAPQTVDGAAGSVDFDPVLATAGDVTIAGWVEGVNNDVTIRFSDGQGINWGASQIIDGDAGTTRKDMQEGDIQIAGNNVYVTWKDERAGATFDDVFFNASNDGGATFNGEVRIDPTFAVGVGAVRSWRHAAEGNNVYILLEVDPNTSSNEELYLVTSTDNGATFNAPVFVPQGVAPGAFDIDLSDMAVDGGTVHVVWADNRSGIDTVYYQQTNDGGATWLAADTVMSTAGGDADGVPVVDATNGIVAVAWDEEVPDGAPEASRANVSLDGGLTFNGDVTVGNYAAGVDDTDNRVVGVSSIGTVIVVWEDNRTGGDEIYAASSNDGGLTYNETQLSTTGGGFPRIVEAGDGCDVVAWTSGNFPNTANASMTQDGGATWFGDTQISDNTGDVDFAEVVWNDLYDNAIVAYLSDDGGANDVYVGGFRAATVTPIGWDDIYNPASTVLGFDFSGFGNNGIAIIGLSAGTGPLPTPDGRLWNLGPTIGPFGGPGFEAVLVGGSGSTLQFPNIFAGGGPAVGLNVFYAAAGFAGTGADFLTDTFSFQL